MDFIEINALKCIAIVFDWSVSGDKQANPFNLKFIPNEISQIILDFLFFKIFGNMLLTYDPKTQTYIRMPQLESFETKHKINPINFEIRCATINKNNNLITRGRWVALRNPSNEHVIITKSGDLIVGGDNQNNVFGLNAPQKYMNLQTQLIFHPFFVDRNHPSLVMILC